MSDTTSDVTAVSGKKRKWSYQATFAVGALLWLLGGLLANTVQTGGGDIRTQEVSYFTESGAKMAGLLYIPKTATTEAPACGVVAIHGYINSRDTMADISVEAARRGCVVLAPDQTGHGFSDAPAFADGYGGLASFSYLNSLPFVEGNNVAFVGHSMGGWASLVGAAQLGGAQAAALQAGEDPTELPSYRSLTFLSSAPDVAGVAPIPASTQFPTNVAVIEAKYSEFSQLMWDVAKGEDFATSPKLKAMFGTDQDVVEGQVYGDVSNGSGRIFWNENTTHPAITQDSAAIGHTMEWLQTTLTGMSETPSGQTWFWQEFGLTIALIGVLLVILPTGALLLRMPAFRGVVRPTGPVVGLKGPAWIGGVILSAVISVLTFYWLNDWATKADAEGNANIAASPWHSQTITTGIATWAVFGAIVSILLMVVFHFTTNRGKTNVLASYGFGENGRIPVKPILLGLVVAFLALVPTYVMVTLSQWFWSSDVRWWIYNIKPLDWTHVKIWISYIPFFTIYFVVLATVLHSQFRREQGRAIVEVIRNIVVVTIAYILFIGIEYGVLFARGDLLTSTQPLLTIVAIQFIPTFIIVGAVLSWFNRKSGWIWPGAFLCAIFVTAQIVAGTATQAIPW